MKSRGIVMLMMAAAMLFSSLAQAAGIMATDGWIREAPPGATSMAGYLKIHNMGTETRTLVGASSNAFGMVMLHRTVMEGEMAKMVHQNSIAIPAGGELLFAPSGYHLMMMKPKQQLKAGDLVDVTLEFANGETLKVTHQVRAAMGEGMDHSHHMMGH